MPARFPILNEGLARCRLVLSAVTLVAVYVDPGQPMAATWIPLRGGFFTMDPLQLMVMGTHLGYSVLLFVTRRAVISRPRVSLAAMWCDVLFGCAIAVVTEGSTSPFYAFFAFAVTEAGLTGGLRRAILVTSVSVGLYLNLIVFSEGEVSMRIMRPVYISITGYLIGYLGQRQLNLEGGIRELAAAAQRQQIARDLHDGRTQALAGISLRLESCQELLRQERHTEALLELSELQGSVNREYDELRTYMRSLVGAGATPLRNGAGEQTRFSIRAQFEGSGMLVHQVLQILGEGVVNVMRHAHAASAALRVEGTHGELRISIDDDGVGFATSEQQPWSIASRVSDLGGALHRAHNKVAGAHLAITLPAQ